MDFDKYRKRKRLFRTYSRAQYFFSFRSLVLCFSFLVFLLFLSSHHFPINQLAIRPIISSSNTLTLLSSSARSSILDSFSSSKKQFSPLLRVEDRILFPDHVLFMVTNRVQHGELLDCVYYNFLNDSSDFLDNKKNSQVGFDVRPVLSADNYDEFRSIVRCPLPPVNFSGTVNLQRRDYAALYNDLSPRVNQTLYSWDKVVYEAILDGHTVVVFVKGLNLRPHRISNPNQLRCHFGSGNWMKDEGFMLTTEAISAAQEVVRCLLPWSIRNNPDKVKGIQLTVSHPIGNPRHPIQETIPSVAKIHTSNTSEQKSNKEMKKKFELCVCTMVWNQASALKEWIMYHAWLGVERWFIYDNNSDDEIDKTIDDLNLQNYNISRQTWPWIKTQEAGFSHCILRARDECNWVGFFDVDEFFYLPHAFRHYLGPGIPGLNGLRDLVANFSSSQTIAEIRTDCHSFGPSGLTVPPKQGVTAGYTCRLQNPERHKSIVRPDLLDSTLLNVVHHFSLKDGFDYFSVPESIALINHYKYQVWETFQAKFYRRVATYVVDWQEDQNQGSKDRAPGLGTEAVEPPNWRLQFCEVWDTGLRDFVLAYFADPATRSLPWERSIF